MHKGDAAMDMDTDVDMTVGMMTAGKDASAQDECMYATDITMIATAGHGWYMQDQRIIRLTRL